jgi:type I restriction-modification system DNA methylase subunit
MNKTVLRSELSRLISEFKKHNTWKTSEESVQSHYTLDLLRVLGWEKGGIVINQGQEVKTGKKPDIVLKDDNAASILVIESKDASKRDMLDGRYQSKTFVEQLNGYCKAEGIWWGILTNFVEWRVYSIFQNRLYEDKKYAFHEILWPNANPTEYVDIHADEGIEFLTKLSKPSLISSQGRWSESTIFYPPQEQIREDFFEKLKSWRSSLRSHIRKEFGDKYPIDQIDLMTQRLLDRLIFIDYCADNAVISQNKLYAILHSREDKWMELKRIFSEMDEKFNSELFSPNGCDDLYIKDDAIVPIIKQLSAIDFKRLSVHIIGEVYESFLAELLKKSRGGIRVEEQSAGRKKKSQGIYYTPDDIVDQIVVNTVGKTLSSCKTEKDLERIRVLDPACGSGSFLIRVFEEFKRNYERVNNNQTGLFEFDTRRKILQNNIFGVDLDERAVEIAKLNLMIKALEGISWQDIKGRKLLPNLKLNIRCGNSLVSGDLVVDETDIFNGSRTEVLKKLTALHERFHKSSDDERNTAFDDILTNEEIINRNANSGLTGYFSDLPSTKPFNYLSAFPSVFANGGFDVVVGNPPYIKLHNIEKELLAYCFKYYDTAEKKCDIYSFFVERVLRLLLKDNGTLGFIISDTWLNLDSFKALRKIVTKENRLLQITRIENPFAKVSVSPILFFVRKERQSKYSFNVLDYDIHKKVVAGQKTVSTSTINAPNFIIDLSSSSAMQNLTHKIEFQSVQLAEIAHLQYGIMTADNNRFVLSYSKTKNCQPLLSGEDISRYSINWQGNRFVDYRPEEMKKKATARPGEPERFEQKEKIVFQRYSGSRLIATIDTRQFYTLGTTIIAKNTSDYSNYYLLSIINSKLMEWWYGRTYTSPTNYIREFEIIPIKKLSSDHDNRICSSLIDLCKEILKLNDSKAKNDLKLAQIRAVEQEIDGNVFRLYGLSPTEIDLVECTLKERKK